MKKSILLSTGLAVMLLSGCATTGDPTQGGLFAWSPTKANQRAADLDTREQQERGNLASARSERTRLNAQSQSLDVQLSIQKAKLERMLIELREIEAAGADSGQVASEAATLRSRIAQLKNASMPDDGQVAALNRDLKALRSKVNTLKNQ